VVSNGRITAGLGRLFVVLPAMTAIAGTGSPVSAGDWPQWRGGAQRSGTVAEASVLTDLAEGRVLKEVWRSESLPNGYGEQTDQIVGQGSPVIWGDKVYLYINWPDTNSIPVGRFKFPKRVNDTVLHATSLPAPRMRTDDGGAI
jgi:hypothetical protein